MKTAKISIADFSFQFAGYGHYRIVYTSPKTGKKWAATTYDMPLIDATKNADTPKISDLTRLKNTCKC